MRTIARSVNEGIELVEKMLKGGVSVNGEWFEEGVEEAYLDWGAINNYDINISCKYFADEVGREFQMRGYFVYYQVMGYGSSRIPQGTPICIRIRKEPKESGSYAVF